MARGFLFFAVISLLGWAACGGNPAGGGPKTEESIGPVGYIADIQKLAADVMASGTFQRLRVYSDLNAFVANSLVEFGVGTATLPFIEAMTHRPNCAATASEIFNCMNSAYIYSHGPIDEVMQSIDTGEFQVPTAYCVRVIWVGRVEHSGGPAWFVKTSSEELWSAYAEVPMPPPSNLVTLPFNPVMCDPE